MAAVGLYFEEFEIGTLYRTAQHTVTSEEIAAFADLTGDNNPLHTDPDVARSAGFPDVIAHGLLVHSLAVGLVADLGIMRSTTIALLSTEARFVAPTVAGDSITVELKITRKRRTADGRRGLLWRRATVLNQTGTTVVVSRFVNLMRLKSA